MSTTPESLAVLFKQGLQYVAARQWDDASACFQRALLVEPNCPQAYNNLGNIHKELGRLEHAVASYEQAIRLNAGYVEARCNLGNTLQMQGRLDEAEACLRHTLRLRPAYFEGFLSLGMVLYLQAIYMQPDLAADQSSQDQPSPKKNRLEEALSCFRQAVRLRPASSEAFNNQGTALAALGCLDEAGASFLQAARHNPDNVGAYKNLGALYKQQGNLEKAAQYFQRTLELLPSDETARFMIAALTGKEKPRTPPPKYIVELFDDYAGRFDDHLVNVLSYRGPQLLREAISHAPGSPPLDILDLGCGTGLCGLAFRDLARSITGVDLSARMLAQAKSRGIYDHLIQGDILEALHRADAAFDLILAGDVFVYVGDLSAVFPAVRKALRPGGRIALQVEACEEDGFVLRRSARFAHSTPYIRELARLSGLAEVSFRKEVLRTESHKDIAGYVFVLSLPA